MVHHYGVENDDSYSEEVDWERSYKVAEAANRKLKADLKRARKAIRVALSEEPRWMGLSWPTVDALEDALKPAKQGKR